MRKELNRMSEEDEILSTISNPVDLIIVEKILSAFIINGYTYKARKEYAPKDWNGEKGYRIFCYIKKGKEGLIINTKGWHVESVCLQVRILNSDTFNKIGEYSENVRNCFLNARNCEMHSDECGIRAYVFKYQGKEHRKCHMICENFGFRNLTEQDIPSIMDIVQGEFDLRKLSHIK
jgi:hypothetical protein